MIKTHKNLADLKKDFDPIMKSQDKNNDCDDDEWEDIDDIEEEPETRSSSEKSIEHDVDDQEFVEVMSRNMRKKKRQNKNVTQADQKRRSLNKFDCEM